jgi:hypothetical protein
MKDNIPNSHTPTPWFYAEGESGDRSVGLDATAPCIYAEIAVPIEGEEYPFEDTVTIAQLADPAYVLPRRLWNESDWLEYEDGYGDYAAGTRFTGSQQANGEHIVNCVNRLTGVLPSTLAKDVSVKEIMLEAHLLISALEDEISYPSGKILPAYIEIGERIKNILPALYDFFKSGDE